MAIRESLPLGAPCWIDLSSSDPERAKEFYARLFGWEGVDGGEEYGGYVTFSKKDRSVAGMMANSADSGVPDGWSVYLASEDAAASVDAAVAAGGRTMVDPMEVPGAGTMAFVLDPGGAQTGIWQPAEHRGFGILGEAGAPVWHELQTKEYSASLDFYRNVFGWPVEVMADTDDFKYSNLVIDGEQLAGVMDAAGFLPAESPSSWRVYFGSDDVDASVELVRELGGSVIADPEDSPYGRLAEVADPTGAVFKLSSNEG